MVDMGIGNLCEKKLTLVLVYVWAGWLVAGMSIKISNHIYFFV